MQISKTQYVLGLRCPKALWLRKYRNELAAEPDVRRQTGLTYGTLPYAFPPESAHTST